jgi:cobalt-zinc-cadmium efflux system outer membrane protein
MPLGSSARSAIAVGEQQAGRQELDARRSAAWLQSYQHLFAQFQEMQHARLEVTTLRERMIPLAEKSLASTQAGYEQTRYSFLQVAQASAVLLSLRRDAIDAAARCHQLLADIDRATALPGDPQP